MRYSIEVTARGGVKYLNYNNMVDWQCSTTSCFIVSVRYYVVELGFPDWME